MNEELEVLRQHVESLGLDQKAGGIDVNDQKALKDSLYEADEFALADYVAKLKDPSELEDLIVNTLYG